MHILKRLLLLCFMGAGVQALRSQPAPPPEVKDQPDAARKEQAGQKTSQAQATSAVVSAPVPGAAMDAEAEQRARNLLHQITTGLTLPSAPEKSALPRRGLRVDTAKTQSPASASNVTTTSVADQAVEEAQREKEIARIEAAVEEARKRRVQAAAPEPSAARVLSTQAPTAPSSISPPVATWPDRLKQGQRTEAASPLISPPTAAAAAPASTAAPVPAVAAPAPVVTSSAPVVTSSAPVVASPAPVVASPAPVVASPAPVVVPPPAVASAPSTGGLLAGIPASPDHPTLTAEAEQKARELVRQNTIIIYSDNPTPQTVPQPERVGAIRPSGFLVDAAPPPKDITVALADSPNARVASPAAAPASGGTLTPDDEQKARALLDQLTGKKPGPAPKPAAPASPRSSLLPRPAPSALDLPTNSVPSAVQAPPTTKAAPSPSLPSAAPAAPAAPKGPTLSADQESKARDLLNQSYPEVSHGKAFTVAVPPPAPAPARPFVQPAPATTIPAAPQAQPRALSPEEQARARDLLNQRLNEANAAAAPVAPPPAVVTTAPAAAPAQPLPAALPSTRSVPALRSNLTPEQEASARALVSQQVSSLRQGPAVPAVSLPPPIAPAPAPQPVISPSVPAVPPPTVALPPPVQATAPASAPAVPVTQPKPGALTPEQEAKARAALEQAERQVSPIASIPPNLPTTVTPAVPSQADSAAELKAKRDLIKQQEREGKKRRDAEKKIEQEAARKRAEQEAKTKKEMDRLDREAKIKAREEARRQLEAEAKVHQEARVRDPKPQERTTLTTPSPVNSAPAPAPAKTKPVTKPSKADSRKNAAAPAPVATGPQTKKQRLDSLTDAYLHDKVSAEAYHRERAKILAEPGD